MSIFYMMPVFHKGNKVELLETAYVGTISRNPLVLFFREHRKFEKLYSKGTQGIVVGYDTTGNHPITYDVKFGDDIVVGVEEHKLKICS